MVTVEDVNEEPSFEEAGGLTLSIPENTTGTIGAPVAATDPDGDALAFHLAGADRTLFEVDTATGQLSVAGATSLDFETQTTYGFEIIATDSHGLQARRSVIVKLLNVNEAPIFAEIDDLTLSVAENSSGAIGGPVSVVDPDGDAVTFELAGADRVSFAIDATTGQLSVGRGIALDFETQSSYKFEIVVSDPHGLRARRTVVVIIENTNEKPVFAETGDLTLSVPETASGVIGDPVIANDPDGDVLQYQLAGVDRTSFAVDAVTGQLSVAAAADFDFQTQSTYRFEILATDPLGLQARRSVIVKILNVNEAPVFSGTGDVTLNLSENSSGAFGEPVTAIDPDGDAVTYRLEKCGYRERRLCVDALVFLSIEA